MKIAIMIFFIFSCSNDGPTNIDGGVQENMVFDTIVRNSLSIEQTSSTLREHLNEAYFAKGSNSSRLLLLDGAITKDTLLRENCKIRWKTEVDLLLHVFLLFPNQNELVPGNYFFERETGVTNDVLIGVFSASYQNVTDLSEYKERVVEQFFARPYFGIDDNQSNVLKTELQIKELYNEYDISFVLTLNTGMKIYGGYKGSLTPYFNDYNYFLSVCGE